jgi:hypothetical protein
MQKECEERGDAIWIFSPQMYNGLRSGMCHVTSFLSLRYKDSFLHAYLNDVIEDESM